MFCSISLCTIVRIMYKHLTPFLFTLVGFLVKVTAATGAASNDNLNPLIFKTNDCFLTEPVYQHKFDFSVLRSDFAHLTVSDTGDIFEFNICGNLSRTCHNRSDTAACLKRSNEQEFVLGTQHELNYHNGRMYFSFTNGEKCASGKTNETYQLHVFLGCDYTLDTKQSKITSYSEDACSFYITYETPYACLPEPKTIMGRNCSVEDSKTGLTYELGSLSDTNYRTTDRKGNAFIINICKPVLYGENAMCPLGSSVCFVDLNAKDYTKKFFDYGLAHAQPVIDNGQLIMRHISLTPCNGSTNYSSTIYFYCDKDVKNAHPELMGYHGCLYEFSFATPLACNDLAPCTAVTHGNEILDLSSLKDKTFTLQQDKQNYKFGVCSHPGEPCMESDGACLSVNGQSTSLGNGNSHLRINQTGTPYLLYENGANCETSKNVKTKWSTKIEFVCAHSVNSNRSNDKDNSGSNGSSSTSKDDSITAVGPKIIENSNCQLLIHYQTELACQEQITCKAKVYVDHTEDGTGAEVIDLTPLISTNKNYQAKVDAATINEHRLPNSIKFFLNVCRPLVPKYGLGCPGGSAACMAKMDKITGKPEEEQSLGFPLASLVPINRTTAELRYLLGTACFENKAKQLSSSILFNCDMKFGRGLPTLRQITDCHYQFSWPTNVICPPHMCIFNENTCEITNEEINVSYNLKKAPFANNGKITISKDKTAFILNLCDSHHKAVTDYSQSLVNLFFTSKGPCGGDGIINVQMRLICHYVNEQTFSFSECNLVYIQKTPDICKFLGLQIPITATTTAASVITSSSTTTMENSNQNVDEMQKIPAQPIERNGSIGTILGAILSVTFFVLCMGIFAFSPERRNSLRRFCQRTTTAVRYIRVNNEEANLLLEPNGDFTESDDDDMIL
ncbi:lysosomal enzyme receptor protein isoform 1-T1 [Glossina fuscipes fuscipes]